MAKNLHSTRTIIRPQAAVYDEGMRAYRRR